jgi:elongator complex protein 2
VYSCASTTLLDDQYLLSVSRDRHVGVYQHTPDADSLYTLICKFKGHSRIVWSCSWAADDSFFVTGSRDATVNVWNLVDGKCNRMASLPTFEDAVTAVSMCPVVCGETHFLVVGLENGLCQLWGSIDGIAWKRHSVISPHLCHAGAIRRIRWRTSNNTNDSMSLQFATGSVDHSVRIFTIDLDNGDEA